jgi:hypothetical protein
MAIKPPRKGCVSFLEQEPFAVSEISHHPRRYATAIVRLIFSWLRIRPEGRS